MAGKRRRNYAAEYARRQELARQRGFKSYYDQRVRRSPTAPPPTAPERRRRSGHASFADLVHDLRRANVVTPLGHERDASGRYRSIEMVVYVPTGDGDMESRHYWLRGRMADAEHLARLQAELDRLGIRYMAAPSLDIRRRGPQGPDTSDVLEYAEGALEEGLDELEEAAG